MSAKIVNFGVPDRIYTIDELCGVIKGLEQKIAHIVVLIEDESGVWSMCLNGTTAERMNWIVDRGKLLLHDRMTPPK